LFGGNFGFPYERFDRSLASLKTPGRNENLTCSLRPRPNSVDSIKHVASLSHGSSILPTQSEIGCVPPVIPEIGSGVIWVSCRWLSQPKFVDKVVPGAGHLRFRHRRRHAERLLVPLLSLKFGASEVCMSARVQTNLETNSVAPGGHREFNRTF